MLLGLVRESGPAKNAISRALQGFCVDLGWLPFPVLAKRFLPPPRPKIRRAITQNEHEKLVASTRSDEWRDFYCLLWEVGASQSDAAAMTPACVDLERGELSYNRQKTGSLAVMAIGPGLRALLVRLCAQAGPLFPRISRMNANHRAAEFHRKCRLLGISGVSLHSYRYAWAERARVAGYPERWAKAALGHNSSAVHWAYSRGARVVCPLLEGFKV